MKQQLIYLLVCAPLWVAAQTDTSAIGFALSGYAETYYGFDLNKPADGKRPGFVYAHNRHNEFNINIAYLKGTVSAQRFHGNLALMAGTYANANLAAEQATLQNIFEANAGVKLCKKAALWIDAGVFSSHIGFESAVGKDCWTLTRSILADNSPYYEAGAKLSYATQNGRWYFSALALNGWQRIQRAPGHSRMDGGWQVQFKPSASVTLNSSTFFGSDKPDSLSLGRIFHNFYGVFQFNDRFGVTAGFDTGWEESAVEGMSSNFWYSPVLIARYVIDRRLAVAARGEYYSDKNGVIIATGTANGFQTAGFSVNLDVQIHKNAVWRVEGKRYESRDAIFVKGRKAVHSNTVLTTALAFSF